MEVLMKLFQQFLIAIFLVSILSFSCVQANELTKKLNQTECYECKYKPILSETNNFINKNKGDWTQQVDGNFVIFDSLSNAFSYFSDDQQPYVYDRQTGTLITIIRGYFNTGYPKHANYTGMFNSNNLLVRTSTDWGRTWQASDLVYNSNSPTFRDKWARYPSVYPLYFEEDEIMGFAFTAPITVPNASGSWEDGFMTGLYYNGTTVGEIVKSGIVDGETLHWYGSASKLVTFSENDGLGLVLGLLTTRQEGGHNNFGLRKSADFDVWNTVRPSQWSSNKFVPATPDDGRTSSIIDLKKDLNGKLYMSAYGPFASNDVTNRTSIGVSTSDDMGETWSEFNILPFTLVREYAQSYGANPDSVAFGPNNDFTLLDNGDFSFAMYLREYNQSREYDSLNLIHIVEVYWENGAWGVRKVADLSGLWVPYYDEDNPNQASMSNNQLRNEIQITRTVDGSTLIVKWVDLLGVSHNWDESTFTWETSDIFYSGRTVGTGTWTQAKNLTNTPEVDRITWIPDFIPDDLTLPIIKVRTMSIEGETENEARWMQMHTQGADFEQHVTIGHYNAVLSVDEMNSSNVAKVGISGVYPNPASDKANIDFTLTNSGNVSIDIYNIYGEHIANVYDSFINEGFNSININTSNLAAGVYFITLRNAGESVTKQINIIR